MTEIEIAETFYSIQGEGRYSGTPAVFYRNTGCNLSCGVSQEDLPDRSASQEEYESRQSNDAKWTCDTLSTFRSPGDEYNPRQLVEAFEDRGFLDAFSNGAHLVVTGGEPTLPANQEGLTSYLSALFSKTAGSYYNTYPDVVEVETNGTIIPETTFDGYVDQYNVSLKLSNSGMPEDRRINDNAIAFYNSKVKEGNATYKFVVSDKEDINEIESLVNEYNIPERGVMLMPAGATQEQLEDTRTMAVEYARDNGWRFCGRLQVEAWNKTVGV